VIELVSNNYRKWVFVQTLRDFGVEGGPNGKSPLTSFVGFSPENRALFRRCCAFG
jgi:hypothetical protein